MPATITTKPKTTTTKPARTTKAAPAKGSKATQTKTQKPKVEPKPKFVVPTKPTTAPTGIKIEAYTYVDGKGERRFWQGYDAKFKKALMQASRSLPQTKESAEARKILVERGWSTEVGEAAFVKVAQDKADRAKAKAAAKVEKAKTSATTKKAKPKAEQAPAEPEPTENEGDVEDTEVTEEA